MARKFPVVATIFCACGVLLLCALGTWQVQRLQWKNNLQQELDLQFAKDAAQTLLQAEDFMSAQMRRGVVVADIDFSRAVLLRGRVADGHGLVAVVAPAQLDNDGGVVAVEVGCAASPDAKLLQKIAHKKSDIQGVVRVPVWSYWTPENRVDKGDWWREDVQQLAAHWGVASVRPAVMVAENLFTDVDGLAACPVEKSLRNDHRSYAIFWFTMAGVLSAMWALRFLRPYLQSA